MVDQTGSGITVQASIITGMNAAWGSLSSDPLLTDEGHITAASPARGQGAAGAGVYWDILGQPRTNLAGGDLGAEQWVDSTNVGLADWWQMANFGDLSNPANGGPEDGPGGDGLTNLEAYLLGINPNQDAQTTNTAALGFIVHTNLQ